MDGNGRWAKARGLPRLAGHRAGVEALRRRVRAAGELGIDWLTVFAFSSENWSRPQSEVSDLMGLLKLFIRRDLAELHQNGVRVRIIGERDGLQPDIAALLDEAEALTAPNRRLNLVIAFNYGGRDEIARAARKIAGAVASRASSSADDDHAGDRLPTISTRPAFPIRTWSSAPAANCGCPTSCSGRPPTANSSSCPATGPISAATTSPRRSASTRRANGATAACRRVTSHREPAA